MLWEKERGAKATRVRTKNKLMDLAIFGNVDVEQMWWEKGLFDEIGDEILSIYRVYFWESEGQRV